MSELESSLLQRRAVVARILAARGDALAVTGLGSTTYDAFAAGDSPLTFYLWGAMGAAAMIGLGLAHAQPLRRVVVLTGDGEMLMGLGSLATIGAERPKNLSVVVIDNEHYAETGMQRTHTGRGVDLTGIAKAAGFAHAEQVHTQEQLVNVAPRIYSLPGPVFVTVKVAAGSSEVTLPPRDGAYLRSRFRAALLGESRATE
jgi:thiamine pyrophosphate-dependent acetolactate synthase large subunit-like protein